MPISNQRWKNTIISVGERGGEEGRQGGTKGQTKEAGKCDRFDN